MACCLIVAYFCGSLWNRLRRKKSLPEESAWLARYYATTIEPYEQSRTR